MQRFIFIVYLIFTAIPGKGQTVLDVQARYGSVNATTIQQAVNAAIDHRNSQPDTDVIIALPEGRFELNKQISVDGLNAAGSGWLIIQGLGQERTILVDVEYNSAKDVTFEFNRPYRLEISDLTLEGERLTASQGTIVKIDNQLIDIDLDEGYPTPDELFEIETNKANKIRIFQDTPLNSPHYVEGDDNDHQSNRWTFQGDVDHNRNAQTRPSLVRYRIWRFKLSSSEPHPFKVGQRVGVSSKSNRSNWAVFKSGGKDIIVENVTLRRLGRVKFRYGWENIRFTNVKIVRSEINGLPTFYSTDAGPQFGHDSDREDVVNLIVEGCDFRGTVDDVIAFQRVVSGIASNNYWEDGGGALVGINCSEAFLLQNNTFYHCPLEDNRAGAIHFKGAFQPEIVNDRNNYPLKLKWESGSRSEQHDVYFGAENPPPFVGTQVENEFTLLDLLPNTQYYWQVNERNDTEQLGVNMGDTWSFVTPVVASAFDKTEKIPIKVYPNPTINKLNIEGLNFGDEIILYTIEGSQVGQWKVNQKSGIFKLDVTTLDSGIYLVNVEENFFKIVKK